MERLLPHKGSTYNQLTITGNWEARSIELGGQRTLVSSRIRDGWSKDEAFNTPHRKHIHKLTKKRIIKK